MSGDDDHTATVRRGYRFSAAQLLCPPAFPRTVSTLLIRPETRRSVLFESARRHAPTAYLEIVGLVAPRSAGRLTIYLRRINALHRDHVLGELGFSVPTSTQRRSRQLSLKPDAVAMIMAASTCEVLGAWQACGALAEPPRPLRCLDMRLLLTWPEPVA